jgi:hypothetical protein
MAGISAKNLRTSSPFDSVLAATTSKAHVQSNADHQVEVTIYDIPEFGHQFLLPRSLLYLHFATSTDSSIRSSLFAQLPLELVRLAHCWIYLSPTELTTLR